MCGQRRIERSTEGFLPLPRADAPQPRRYSPGLRLLPLSASSDRAGGLSKIKGKG